jgi:outer membrane protein assembly factor BamB
MFHGDSDHTGVSPDTGLTSSGSSTLALRWKVDLSKGAFASPAVAFNSTLGKSLVYIGNLKGVLTAYDGATGALVWSKRLGTTGTFFHASATVRGNVVYDALSDGTMFAVNATTGATVCSYRVADHGVIDTAPVVATPDGTNPVVYFADSGPSGDTADGGGVYAMNGVGSAAGQCTLAWEYHTFSDPPGGLPGVGSYSAPAYEVTATGTPLVVLGTTDPDDSVYAFNALTGARVWRFQTPIGTDADVGAPPTISPPGVNGFADGVVYFEGKDAWVFALDLTTGAPIWSLNTRNVGGAQPTQTSAALLGNTIYEGDSLGFHAFNATNGSVVWTNDTTGKVISSPAIAGPAGDQIMFAGTLTGAFMAFDLATGQPEFSYQTGGVLLSSPAIANNTVYIAGDDGFLYAFGE